MYPSDFSKSIFFSSSFSVESFSLSEFNNPIGSSKSIFSKFLILMILVHSRPLYICKFVVYLLRRQINFLHPVEAWLAPWLFVFCNVSKFFSTKVNAEIRCLLVALRFSSFSSFPTSNLFFNAQKFPSFRLLQGLSRRMSIV